MKQKYQGSTKVRRAQLQVLGREFETLSMKKGERVDKYLSRTLTVAKMMKIHKNGYNKAQWLVKS